MNGKINIGSIQMPINAATKSFAVLAKRGAGKTYLGGATPAGAVSGIPVFVSTDKLDMWRSKLGNGAAMKILNFLAENSGQQFTKQQIGLATGLSMGASTMRVAIGKLKRTGIVLQQGDKLMISPDL